MSHARVEELSDSDPEIEDPSSISFPQSSSSIIAPANIPAASTSERARPSAYNGAQHHSPDSMPSLLRPTGSTSKAPSKDSIKFHSTLYPVYFDISRSRAQGRRVSSKLGVSNPLARDIAEACQFISARQAGGKLQIAFEPDKTHPKDWANPGRVRLLMRDRGTGKPLSPAVKNKSHLYILVAQYLQAHPITKESPLKLQIQGVPAPEKLEPPAVPRGWKINEILPLHSPAMSGGGVSENFFKDMMTDMQKGGGAGVPQLPPAMAEMFAGAGGGAAGSQAGSSGEGSRKKEKKKKKGK
jgi:signal recognition particle subunit SRP19